MCLITLFIDHFGLVIDFGVNVLSFGLQSGMSQSDVAFLTVVASVVCVVDKATRLVNQGSLVSYFCQKNAQISS